jgi:hypothetical protein
LPKAGSADILSAGAGRQFTSALVAATVEADRMSALPASWFVWIRGSLFCCLEKCHPRNHAKETRIHTKSGLCSCYFVSFRFVLFRGSSAIPMLIKLQRTLETGHCFQKSHGEVNAGTGAGTVSRKPTDLRRMDATMVSTSSGVRTVCAWWNTQSISSL